MKNEIITVCVEVLITLFVLLYRYEWSKIDIKDQEKMLQKDLLFFYLAY
jgi:hypothetical protein